MRSLPGIAFLALASPLLAEGPKAPASGQEWQELASYWDGRDVFYDAADIHLYRSDKSIVTAHATTVYPDEQESGAVRFRASEDWFYFDCSGRPAEMYRNGGIRTLLDSDGTVVASSKLEGTVEHRLNDDVAAYDLAAEICRRVAKGEGKKFY